MSLCCVWDSLLFVCGNEFVLCVGQFGACLERVILCCLWDSLGRVWGIDFVLCVGEFGAGLGERFCAEFVSVWCGYGGVRL